MMKAIVYSHYGAPDVLRLAEIEKPKPTKSELLIRVHAVEVTKADCELRSFKFPVNWFSLPLRLALGIRRPRKQVLGGYFSGVVESVGSQVSEFKRGDAVIATAGFRFGAYGEYLCLPSDYSIAPKPEGLSFEQAAAIPLGGLNALHFMRKANIRAGEKVLINGAGGSIGIFAVQIAKSMGAEVTAVDGAHKMDLLRRIGADHVVDYGKEDFSKRGQSYDVVFNMVANSSFSDCVGLLKPEGRYLIGNPRLSDMLRSAIANRFGGKKVIYAFAGETKEELVELSAMAEAGEIKPVIDTVYAPEQAADAHRRVESEQRQGIVVIRQFDEVSTGA